jgi:hypothetical protein
MAPSGLSKPVVVLLMCWITACGSEPLTPGTIQTFELRAVGRQPVPAVYDSSAYGYSTAVRGSFRFSGEGHVLWTWEEHDVFRPSLEEPFRESSYSYRTTLPYTVHGTEFKIGDDCPLDTISSCAAPMTGSIVGTKLILHPGFGRADWMFVQAGS